jgi:hypothetical protein
MNTTTKSTFIRPVASGLFFLFVLTAIASAQEPPRPWDLSFRWFTDYDSNIALAPRNKAASGFSGHKGGVDLGLGVSGSYKFIDERQWDLGAGGQFVQIWNTRAGLSSFNLTSVSPRLLADYFCSAGTMPGQAQMGYQYRRDWLHGVAFEQSHTLSWDVGIIPIPKLSTDIYYNLAFEDFDNDGVARRLTSRDATNHAVGLKGTYAWGYNKPAFTLNYQFSHNDADGRNFTFNSHSISGQFITPIILPLRLKLDAGYTNQDYTRFTPHPERTQDNQNYGATLLLPLSRNISADWGYAFSKFKGSQSRFEASRHKVTLGLTYSVR